MNGDLAKNDVTPLPKPVAQLPLCACGCGRQVTFNQRRGRPNTLLSGHYLNRDKSVERDCLSCGKTFRAKPSDVSRGGGKFCSRDCWRAAPPKRSPEKVARLREDMQQSRTGDKNPNFRHGRRGGCHIRGWSIAAKGDSICRVCGGQAIDLHHAVPRSMCPPVAKRDLRNGLPLCKACHARWHRGTPIDRCVFTREEWVYISTLKLTGREVDGWLDKRYPAMAEAAA